MYCIQQVSGVKSTAAREESPPIMYGLDNILKYRKKTSLRQLQHASAGFEFALSQVHIQ